MTGMSSTELSREKSQFLADQMRSKVIEELLEFDRSLLMTVETVLKNKLPSADGEKFSYYYYYVDLIQFPPVLEIERRQAVDSDLTHTKNLVLHSVVTFDPAGLHHVVTQVKNRLPSLSSKSH